MRKTSQNIEVQSIINLIDQLSDGNWDLKEVPETVSSDFKLIVNKLIKLHTKISDSSLINNQYEKDERYRTLVESAPFCIHEIDHEGNIISMNPAGLKMLGLENSSEVYGANYLSFVDDQNKKKVKSLIKKAFKGQSCTLEYTSTQSGIATHLKTNFIPIYSNSKIEDSKPVTKIMGITQDISESVLTNKALQSSREDLQMVIESIDEIVYSIDLTRSNPVDGEIIYLSPKVENILGYTVNEFVNNRGLWFSLIHPEDKASMSNISNNLLEDSKPITRYYRLKSHKSDEYFWFEDKVSPKVDQNGNVIGFIGSARDVTDRKNTEQALKNSEEKYRAFFEKAPIGIGLADMKGNLIAFNDAILKPGKYTKKDAKVIRNVKEFYYNNKTRKETIKELKTKGFVDQKEVLFKKKDGSPYFASMSLTPLTLDGKPFIMALVKDISESKEIEEALIESEARNKTIVENVQEAIVIFEDGRKEFIDFNKNAIKLFGYNARELRRMTPAQLSPEYQPDGQTSNESARKRIEKALSGKKQLFEWVHADNKGREFPCEIHLTRVPYKDRFVVMGSVVDISERKKVELERENLIKELDRFVYSASHDLSAPLKSILGLLNVIRLEPEGSQILGYLDKMEQSIYKLEDFIKEIIQYSRNTRLEVKNEKINLEKLVKEILEELKFSDGYNNISIRIDFSDLPEIITDPFRLKVVLNNLISNSIKFHKRIYDKKPFIKVKGKIKGRKARIDVIDNGQGISEESIHSIFDMFYRGSHSSSGSGLGLYIAKEAAQNINGYLKVKSKYGEGSTFSLILEQKKSDSK